MREFPELKSYDTGHHFTIWCRFCNRWHVHSRYEGHAVSHCTDRRPGHYYENGYVLVDNEPAPEWVMRDVRRRRPKGPVTG